MKTFSRFALATALFVFASACAREDRPEQTPSGPESPATPGQEVLVPMTIRVGSEQIGTSAQPASKTYVYENEDGTLRQFHWEEDDEIALYDAVGGQKHSFKVSGTPNGKYADFSGEAAEDPTEVWVVYPKSAASGLEKDDDDYLLTATLPSIQTLGSNNAAQGALLAVGYGSDANNISMHNVFGLVKVTVGFDDVTKIVVGGTNLAGSVKVNAKTGILSEVVDGTDTVTLLPDSEGGIFEAGDYFISILQGGVISSVELVRGDDAHLSCNATATLGTGKTVVRNSGFKFSDQASVFTWTWHIYDKDGLFDWNSRYSSWQATDKVYLENDIDMGSETWTPHTFKGTFDGRGTINVAENGHKLYNFICNPNSFQSGFFSFLCGTVEYLILGSSDGTNWDNTSIVKHEYSGSETTWPNAGSVAARLETGGKVYKVTNFASVEQGANDVKQRCRVGGIVGFVGTKDCKGIEDCVNYGAVSNNCSSTTANQPVGGILGSAEWQVTLANCTNRGAVTSNCAGAYFVGGIMGCTNGPAAVSSSETDANSFVSILTGCKNYGTVEVNASASVHVGGIVGSLTGGQLTECENHASVSSAVRNMQNCVGGIAGVFYRWNKSSIINCSNDGEISAPETTGYNNVGGIIGYVSSTAKAILDITGSNNTGIVHCSATLKSGENNTQATAGGIIGRTELGGCTIKQCSNAGEVYIDGTATMQRNIGGICGVTTNGSTFDGCTNSGTIHNKTNYSQARIGGLFGHGAAFTLKCDSGQSINSGKVYGYSAVNDGAMGGIAGYAQGGFTIEGTDKDYVLNSGEVFSDDATARTWIGGITGFTGDGTNNRISYAKNAGKVSKNNTNNAHSAIGGIMGRVQASSTIVENCINEGLLEDIGKSDNYRWVGGIVGRAFMNTKTSSMLIRQCTNKANITLSSTGNKKTNGFVIAGILGSGNRNCTVQDNVNTGDITITSGNATAMPHAAGIYGDDVDVDTNGNPDSWKTVVANTITGNTNGGTITANGNASQARIGAGGIIGRLNYTSSVTTIGNNTNSGNVVAKKGTTIISGASATGGSGALIGDLQTALTNAPSDNKVSKSITVGGVSYSVAETEGKLDYWLCPNNNGNITAIYQ